MLIDMEEEPGIWNRYVFKFTSDVQFVARIEGRKNYVLQFSIRDSEVVDRHRLAVCERPGAMARDEAGMTQRAKETTLHDQSEKEGGA
ncbi:hypothetical protein OESDEN_09740 [Oesophagostomum dentatum]|uniref:Uncharacterized protein n=1 Tax=Oesophagostomum dentatum TaxID=61180 RepID=A0A0B1SYN0_OESDE|nr:hypothetical protein OESDEN_09740 [Oesophagostomum dentatum]